MLKSRVEQAAKDVIEKAKQDGDDIEVSTKVSRSKAKSSEEYWMDGFQAGYSKAWDSMMPMMLEGVEKSKRKIEEAAIDKAFDNFEPMVEKRIEELKNKELRDMNEIIQKREDLRRRMGLEQDDNTRKNYQNMINLCDWIIVKHGNKL